MDLGFIQQPQTFILGALEKIDFDSSFCTILGINNLAHCAATLKKSEYQESLTEFMKAAAKWTAIGTVFFGMQKLAVSMRPIYLDDVHERAYNELNAWGHEGQGISKDAQDLLNRYFTNNYSFKRWPQSGKDFIQECLKSNSPAAKANTRYFMEQSVIKNDFGLSETILKTCAAARSSTSSCQLAQQMVLKNSENQVNKMVRLCGENQNDFCQNARNVRVNIAVKNDDWNKIIKDCLHSKLAVPTCSAALTSFEEILKVPSKQTWETAKKVNLACGNKHLAVCQKAKNIVITHTMNYGDWEEVLKTLSKECKMPTEECTTLIEEASAKFFSEVPNGIPVHKIWDIYFELQYPLRHSGPPSTVSLAMKLANACLSQGAIKPAHKLISMLETYKDALSKERFYTWERQEIIPKIAAKLVDLKEKLNNLPVQSA